MSGQWYYQSQGNAIGPLPSDTLRQLARAGGLTRDTLVRREGTQAWVRAAQIADLWEKVSEPAVASAPAPPPNPSVTKRPPPPRLAEAARKPGPLPTGPPPVTAELDELAAVGGAPPIPPERPDAEATLVAAQIHDCIFASTCAVAAAALIPLPLCWLWGGPTGFWIGFTLSGLLVFAAGVLLVLALLERRASTIVLTSHRLQATAGIFVRSSLDLPLDKIDAIEIQQDLCGMFAGYGTLYISGHGVSTLAIAYVASPETVSEAITKAIAESR